MLEKDIEAQARKNLERNGWVVEKNHQTMMNFGRPDLHAAHPTLGEWWIEMKKPGGKLGQKQWKWMLRWHKVCNIIVCDDVNPEAIIREWDQSCDRRAGPLNQWQPWMTGEQKREARTGRTSLDDAMDDWSGTP